MPVRQFERVISKLLVIVYIDDSGFPSVPKRNGSDSMSWSTGRFADEPIISHQGDVIRNASLDSENRICLRGKLRVF